MARNESNDSEDVSKLSRRGLLTLGATLASVGGLGALSGTASAHGLMAFRDAFIGKDGDEQGLGSKGWLFFAKDTGDVYYHDGGGWRDLPIGGNSVLADTDSDGLLETSDHDGIDIEGDGAALNLDTASGGQNARLRWKEAGSNRFNLRYSPSNDYLDLYDFSQGASAFRVNEGGPIEVKNNLLTADSGVSIEGSRYGDANLTVRAGGDYGVTIKGDSKYLFNVIDSATTEARFRVVQNGPVEINHTKLVQNNTDMKNTSAGSGIILTTPDGTSEYRVRVDNDGNLTTEQVS